MRVVERRPAVIHPRRPLGVPRGRRRARPIRAPVPTHLLDGAGAVVIHSEGVATRQREGAIRLAQPFRLPACRPAQADHDSAKTARYLADAGEVENEIAVALVDQPFQLLLHGPALPDADDVVAELHENHLADLFVVERGLRGVQSQHTDP